MRKLTILCLSLAFLAPLAGVNVQPAYADEPFAGQTVIVKQGEPEGGSKPSGPIRKPTPKPGPRDGGDDD